MKVLLDTRSRHWDQNPYMRMLADGLSRKAEVIGFSWKYALLGRYDVLHLHWPEYLMKHNQIWRRVAARFFLLALLVRLVVSKVTVIQTRHNKNPHAGVSYFDNWILKLLDGLVSVEIRMNKLPVETGAAPESRRIVYILHGHYLPYVSDLNLNTTQAENLDHKCRLLCFGILREYKCFDEVMNAVADSDDKDGFSLVVTGSPVDENYTSRLSSIARNCTGNVDLRLGRVDDKALIELIRDTNFVVVPYADLYNSGVVLLALSLNIPVILRDSQAARDFQKEFGPVWVRIYSGTLTASTLENATLNNPSMVSVLERGVEWKHNRNWTYIADQTLAAYAQGPG